MSSEATRKSINTAGIALPVNGTQLAGWAIYFGEGDPLNTAGAVFQGSQDQETAELVAVIEALRTLRKRQERHHVDEGTHFRILTESGSLPEQSLQTNGQGQVRILQDEMALVEKAGFDVIVDQLKGADRSKNHDECVAMAQHAANNHNRGHQHT